MRRTALFGIIVVLALASFTATGCCTKEKQEIEALRGQYNTVSQQNKDLRTEIVQLTAEKEGLQKELQDLKNKPQPPTPPMGDGPAEGWKTGTFGDQISVGSDLLFSAGSATLTNAGKASLDKIVNDIKTTYPGLAIRVYGYTDSDPILKTKRLWADNLDLSSNRAMAVTRYLISKGLPAENIETIGMGATHFVASNTTKDGKAKNRRVEIFVIKTK